MSYNRHLPKPLTPNQLYWTRLQNILNNIGCSLEELQYFQLRDFSKFRGVGKGLVDYTRGLLREIGLDFGNLTFDYYMKHKEEVQQGKPFNGANGYHEEASWTRYRRQAAKDILCALLTGDTTLDENYAIEQSVRYAYGLVNFLRELETPMKEDEPCKGDE